MKSNGTKPLSKLVCDVIEELTENPLSLHDLRRKFMDYSYLQVSNALHNSIRHGRVAIYKKTHNGGRDGKYVSI